MKKSKGISDLSIVIDPGNNNHGDPVGNEEGSM